VTVSSLIDWYLTMWRYWEEFRVQKDGTLDQVGRDVVPEDRADGEVKKN